MQTAAAIESGIVIRAKAKTRPFISVANLSCTSTSPEKKHKMHGISKYSTEILLVP
jgi:hypothetical protein